MKASYCKVASPAQKSSEVTCLVVVVDTESTTLLLLGLTADSATSFVLLVEGLEFCNTPEAETVAKHLNCVANFT